jgi:hypothetical protein
MAEIEIHFTEYFAGETVVISSAGRELFRAEHLKTDLRTGLAKIARVTVSGERVVLEFAVIPSNASATVTFETAQLKYITIALSDGRLKVTAVSQGDYMREPRGYA